MIALIRGPTSQRTIWLAIDALFQVWEAKVAPHARQISIE